MTVAEVERIGSPQVSRVEARKAFLEYKKALFAERDAARKAEYDGLMRGYRAIAAGQQVVDVQKAMTEAGLQDDTHYPRLAICRADARTCHLTMGADGSVSFRADDPNTRARAKTVRFGPETLPTYRANWDNQRGYLRDGTAGWKNSARAIVPIVPPALHPKAALVNYHILWDAVWTQAPPVDPMLLRHLAGALYAIVATWDLTPLEQAVLRGRL